jgi:hypothetical protein
MTESLVEVWQFLAVNPSQAAHSKIAALLTSHSGAGQAGLSAESARKLEESLLLSQFGMLDQMNESAFLHRPLKLVDTSAPRLSAGSSVVYQPSLNAILSHPVTFEILKQFLHTNYSSENAMFVALARRFEFIQSAALRRQIAALLLEEFIVDKAPNQLNLPSSLVHKMINQLKAAEANPSVAVSRHFFAEADREVRKLITDNRWIEFQQSHAYAVCSNLLVEWAIWVRDFAIAMEGLSIQAETDDAEAMQHDEANIEQSIKSVLDDGTSPSRVHPMQSQKYTYAEKNDQTAFIGDSNLHKKD